MTSDRAIEVRYVPEAKRFEASAGPDGPMAFLDVLPATTVWTLSHTEVPRDLEGRGYGSELVRAALAHLRSEGASVMPLARSWSLTCAVTRRRRTSCTSASATCSVVAVEARRDQQRVAAGGRRRDRGGRVALSERRVARATLCACGRTVHAPFCDGSHRSD